MKIIRKTKHIISWLMLSILVVMMSTQVMAAKAATCVVPYKADTTDIITLAGEGGEEQKTGKESDSFTLTYTEPGTYHYTITDGTRTYKIDVYVMYEDAGLSATPVIYDSDEAKNVEIDFQDVVEISYTVTEGEYSVWKQQSNDRLPFKVNRSVDDAITFSLFTGITVDGNAVGAGMYEASSGSLNLALKSNYLKTLSLGVHTLNFLFQDGSTSTRFSITPSGEPEVPYVVISGAGSEWTRGSEQEGLEFVVQPLGTLSSVEVDGTTISLDDVRMYTTDPSEGHIILLSNLLDGLADGGHTVKFVFSDGSAFTQFSVKTQKPEPQVVVYEVFSGADQTWKKESTQDPYTIGIRKTSPAGESVADIVAVTLNGNPVDPSALSYYSVEADSIYVNIDPSYMDQLTEGIYTIGVQFADGDVSTTVTVEDPAPVPVTYTVTTGADGTWTINDPSATGYELGIVQTPATGDMAQELISLLINSIALDSTQFTVLSSGAGEIHLLVTPAFLNSLGEGGYAVKAIFAHGEADTRLTVKPAKEEPTETPTETPTEKPTEKPTEQPTETPTRHEDPTSPSPEPETPTQPVTRPEQPTTVSPIQPTTKPSTTPTQPVTKPTTTPGINGGANAGGKVNPVSAAKTGDDNNMMLWIVLCVVCMTVAISVLIVTKRKNSHKDTRREDQ